MRPWGSEFEQHSQANGAVVHVGAKNKPSTESTSLGLGFARLWKENGTKMGEKKNSGRRRHAGEDAAQFLRAGARRRRPRPTAVCLEFR